MEPDDMKRLCLSKIEEENVRKHLRWISSFKHGFHLALTSGNFFLANANELEHENFFIFSAGYRSTSEEYRLVSARWKPCFTELK